MKKEENYIDNKEEKYGINYNDLIAAYYYEALFSQNVFYEKYFEKAVGKLKDELLIYLENYLNRKIDAIQILIEKSLYSYIEIFCDRLKQINNAKELFLEINEFIMIIHNKARSRLGWEVLEFSERELKALNYIDIKKPLNEQKKIIEDKIKEEG